jgi:hypothetical protein
MLSLPEDWTDEQRELYTRVHKFMVANKDAMCHPAAPIVTEQHWQTIAHNAAFIAAELRDNEEVRILDAETEATIAESPAARKSH